MMLFLSLQCERIACVLQREKSVARYILLLLFRTAHYCMDEEG